MALEPVPDPALLPSAEWEAYKYAPPYFPPLPEDLDPWATDEYENYFPSALGGVPADTEDNLEQPPSGFADFCGKLEGVGKVLMVGNFNEYSALAWVGAVREVEGGHVTCVDFPGDSIRSTLVAVKEVGGLDNLITVFEGDRVKKLDDMARDQIKFDMVLLDANGEDSHKCFETILKRNLLTPVRGTLIVSPSHSASGGSRTLNHNSGFALRSKQELSSSS